MYFFYTEMKMNVDLKSEPSREIGVDMFNHSNDSTHCDDSDDDDDDDEEEEDEVQEEEEEDEEDLVEEEAEEEYDDDDDDNDDSDNDDDDGDEDDDCESNGSNILKVTPRDLHTNHSSSALHDMSRICWPPGSWHDGTRRSAFQPYRVCSVVVDPRRKESLVPN